jgi:hypothetical protein
MQARVVERVQRSRLGSDDRDAFVADGVLDELAGLDDLLFPARDLPYPRPEPRLLELGEVARGVALLGHETVGPDEQGSEVGHVRIGL